MRITIFAVGQMKSAPEAALCDAFLERVRAQGRAVGISEVRVREFAESRATRAQTRKADESERLAAALPAGARTVVLSEAGRQMTSEQFAALLRDTLDGGAPELAFGIGGPDGHHEDMEASASVLLSLGAMTWPHRLARAMLAEQIYRAVTILTNHPYHRA